jgi:hypothetical protein
MPLVPDTGLLNPSTRVGWMARGSIPPRGATKGIYMSKIKTKKLCTKCGYEFSARGGNYQKHTKICDGTYKPYVKSSCCKHCSLSFDTLSISERANHTRWCINNPARNQYTADTEKMRRGITLESKRKQIEGIKKAHSEGKYKDASKKAYETKKKKGTHLHTKETKQLLREKALSSPHRRLKRGTVEYNGILLDSLWELELAKRLDELKIKWVRPDPIPWVDNDGITHNYFPDFYLIEYDLYLDPKNPQAKKVQKKKLHCLFTQYKNIVIIGSLEECKNYFPRNLNRVEGAKFC